MKYRSILNRFIAPALVLTLCGSLLTGCTSLKENGPAAASSELAQSDGAEETASNAGTSFSFESLLKGSSEEDNWQVEEETRGLTGYYYDQINPDQKQVYNQLYTGISGRKVEFVVESREVSYIEKSLNALLNDHPEFFWLDGEAKIYGPEGGGKEKISLTFNIDPAEIDAVQAKIDQEAGTFLTSVSPTATTYQKVRAAYEWIVRTTDYNLDASQDQNIQSVFLNHASVCAGYAKSFKYLLNHMGIPCELVYGEISDSGIAHVWNLVQIDGIETYVDPTWGDPAYGENQQDSAKLDIIYDYLGMTKEEVLRSRHRFTPDYSYPDCADRTYDFYRLLGDFFEGYDPDSLTAHLHASVRNGDSITYLKFGTFEAYSQAMANLFGNNGLIHDPLRVKMRKEGLGSMQYYYSNSDEMMTIKIFW